MVLITHTDRQREPGKLHRHIFILNWNFVQHNSVTFHHIWHLWWSFNTVLNSHSFAFYWLSQSQFSVSFYSFNTYIYFTLLFTMFKRTIPAKGTRSFDKAKFTSLQSNTYISVRGGTQNYLPVVCGKSIYRVILLL